MCRLTDAPRRRGRECREGAHRERDEAGDGSCGGGRPRQEEGRQHERRRPGREHAVKRRSERGGADGERVDSTAEPAASVVSSSRRRARGPSTRSAIAATESSTTSTPDPARTSSAGASPPCSVVTRLAAPSPERRVPSGHSSMPRCQSIITACSTHQAAPARASRGRPRERQPAARPENARKIGDGGALVREGAERAVDRGVRERQRLGVAAEKRHALLQVGRLGWVDALARCRGPFPGGTRSACRGRLPRPWPRRAGSLSQDLCRPPLHVRLVERQLSSPRHQSAANTASTSSQPL